MENNKISFYKNFKFCFFSRNGGVSKDHQYRSLNCSKSSKDKRSFIKKNRLLVSDYFKSKKKKIFVNQIHSNKVVFVNNSHTEIVNADGMITNRKDIDLGILTADCAPVIIFGKENYGIIHAGWKGAFNGIIKKALEKFDSIGEKTHELSIYIGPHLKKESFEVQPNFFKMLKKFKINNQKYIFSFKRKIFFNFTKFLTDQINIFDVRKIHVSDIDTFKNPQNYFSYRYYLKKGIKNCGRQMSLVGIKE